MNAAAPQEVSEKLRRVREYLDTKGFDAMILGRRDNFSWLTDGGCSEVILPSDTGFCILVVTAEQIYAVAQVMDGPRIMEEELEGLGFEYIPLRWYECSREEKAMELVKGSRVVADIPLQGVSFLPGEIYRLHYPMTGREIAKIRVLGAEVEEVFEACGLAVKPGMTEYEIQALLIQECAKRGIHWDVLLVGSDERIFKYRHPNPSGKRVGKYVLMHFCARKWGLHANVTRSVYFGDRIPDEIAAPYEAANRIQAAVLSMCNPGFGFCDILQEQKRLYKELGYGEEWRNHFQGGITGYLVGDPTLSSDPGNKIVENQPYDWFITITGAKVEELSLNTGGMLEIPSVTGKWPVARYNANGRTFDLSVIRTREP